MPEDMRLLLLAVCAWASLAGAQVQLSSAQVQDILDNPRLLRAYIACVLDQGPCTAEGRQLRDTIPGGLRTSCGSCSPAQKQTVRAVVRVLQDRYPEDWAMLHRYFDPSGEFVDSFQQFLDTDN